MHSWFYAVSASSEKFSLSFSCPRVCGVSHYRSWQSKESWSLPESRCSAIGVFFFFCPQLEVSVTCAGLQWNEHGLRSRERHGPRRKRAVDSCWPNVETTLYRNLVEHERLQRKRSKVRAANTRCRPTCDVGQHAVCIQTGLRKK